MPEGDWPSWEAFASSFARKLRGPPVPALLRDQLARPAALLGAGVDMGASSLRRVLIRIFGVAFAGGETERVLSESEG